MQMGTFVVYQKRKVLEIYTESSQYDHGNCIPNILLKRRKLITFCSPHNSKLDTGSLTMPLQMVKVCMFLSIKILYLLEQVLISSFVIFVYVDGGSAPSEDSPANEWEMAGSNLVSWRPWLLFWYLYGKMSNLMLLPNKLMLFLCY